MSKQKVLGIFLLTGSDWKQGYGFTYEHKTYVPYSIAKLVFEFWDCYEVDDEFAEYCESEDDEVSLSSYCVYKAKLNEEFNSIIRFVKGKSFDSIEEFFQLHQIGSTIKKFECEGEEISEDLFNEASDCGFNHMSETAYYCSDEGVLDTEICGG